ncbi:MAG: RecQ family zinc-binding domain-containing protein, partial [Bacteroidota bacterium]
SQYFNISEISIAQYLKINSEEVFRQLDILEEMGVIHYEKQKALPQLVFLTPRYDAQKLPLNLEEMEARRKEEQRKIKAVTAYAQHQQRCRTLLLLEYFGEISYQKCGVCDICRKEKKPANRENLDDKIRQILQEGPLATRQLISKLNPADEKAALLKIRSLIEVGMLKHRKDGRIEISANFLGKNGIEQ